MRPLKFNKIIIPFIAFAIILSCTVNIEPPTSMRFSASVTIIDSSTTGPDSLVWGANVVMQSITYGDVFEAETNYKGIAKFTGLIPDRYNILATGNRVNLTETIIINGQLQDTSLYIENNDTLRLDVFAQTSKTSALVISEIYYTGAIPNPVPQYFHDQFTEIYNNSSETLYLDSIMIVDVEYGFADDSLIHAVHAYMFPGNGTDYPIGPGEIIVVAQDAIDHSPVPIRSVNLLDAEFEFYVADKGDVDNPASVNMIQIHHKYGNDFLYSVFNNAVLMMKVKDPYKEGYDEFERILLPKKDVIDGVEYRDNTAEMNMKRVDGTIDGGLTGGIPSYSSQSVERYIDHYEDGRMILKDNNNSSLDFHVNKPPTPGYIQEVSE
jgi:hypothetical protein